MFHVTLIDVEEIINVSTQDWEGWVITPIWRIGNGGFYYPNLFTHVLFACIGYLDRGKLRLTVSHDKAEKRQYKTYLEELKEEPIASI